MTLRVPSLRKVLAWLVCPGRVWSLLLVAFLPQAWGADQQSPTVSLDAPLSGATVSHVVLLKATATDDSAVTSVQFFVDGVSIGQVSNPPFVVGWNSTTAANGLHSLTARASDAAGNRATSDVAQVTVVNPGFVNEVVVPGIVAATTMVFLPDGRMLVGELNETIWVIQAGATQKDPVPFLRIDNSDTYGEQGLMDIVLDPDFSTNGYFYIFYTRGFPQLDGRDRVSRFTASGNRADPGSELVIWQDNDTASSEHHGGALAFGIDGKLYITVGDHFNAPQAQQLDSYYGKVLRINSDGSIPVDNPFFDGDGPNLDEIWAMGLRNPFRMSIDPVTGRMYIGDVGGNDNSSAYEEVNLGAPGANYGWPLCEGPCGAAGVTTPWFTYPHAGRDGCVVGGIVYRGSQFPAEYYGTYFFGDYVQNWVKRLTLDPDGNVEALLNFAPADGEEDGPTGDPVKFVQGPDGSLYYVDIGFNDSYVPNEAAIRRIRYIIGNQPPVAKAAATPTSGIPPLDVTFSSVGSIDPEGVALDYQWDFGDGSISTEANPTHRYTNAGAYIARLTVSDGTNSTLASDLNITVGNPPTATILTPTTGISFRAGDTIEFSGAGFDTEDGDLPASAFTWTILFHHEGHIHPTLGPVSGSTNGILSIPLSGHDYSGNTSYEIILRVTDSTGLKGVSSVTVYPDKSNTLFDTVPSGLAIEVNGIRKTTPFVHDDVIGFEDTINAPSQLFSGDVYNFQSWSDLGDQTHTIVVPETNQTIIATYRGPLPIVVEQPAWVGNDFVLKFNSASNRLYNVEYSTNISPADWKPLRTELPGTGDLLEVIDADSASDPQRFYRVSLLPLPEPTGPPQFSRAAEDHDTSVSNLSLQLDASGQNPVLIVGLCWIASGGNTISSLTYGGLACTPIFTTNWYSQNGRVALYHLPAPPAGMHTLNLTMSSLTTELSMSALLITNANQSATVGLPVASFDSEARSAVSVSVPSTENDLIVDILGWYDDSFTYTPGPGQTTRITSSNNGNASNKMSTKPATAGVTPMSWAVDSQHSISQIAVSIKGL